MSNIPAEDPALIERLRDSDTVREAFGEVINRFTEPLYWQIRRLVSNHDDANDLLQNTFMKAWMSIENFRGEARLSTWLYKIAINEAFTFLAREKKRSTVSIDDPESATASNIEADEYTDGDRLATELREVVGTLPEKQRIVFNMKYYDDMKYEDISSILGTSVGALKASYHLAVKKIENFFNKRD